MNSNSVSGSIFAAILGIAAVGFGIAEFVGLGMENTTWGPLTLDVGTFTAWRAIILIGAGLIYLSSVTRFMDTRQLAKAVAASIMVWILAAIDVWAMICASIPSGAEGTGEPWFSSPADFFAAYGYPYMPAIYLLIPSLVIIYFILRRRRVTAGQE